MSETGGNILILYGEAKAEVIRRLEEPARDDRSLEWAQTVMKRLAISLKTEPREEHHRAGRHHTVEKLTVTLDEGVNERDIWIEHGSRSPFEIVEVTKRDYGKMLGRHRPDSAKDVVEASHTLSQAWLTDYPAAA